MAVSGKGWCGIEKEILTKIKEAAIKEA